MPNTLEVLDLGRLPDFPPDRPKPEKHRSEWLVFVNCGQFTQYEMRLMFYQEFGRRPERIALDNFMGEQFWWLGWVAGWEIPGREHEYETVFGRPMPEAAHV